MIEALDALGVAVYEALSGAIEDVPVLQHVPMDTPLPVVVIADIDDAARLPDGDLRVPLTIVVLTEGEERAPCIRLLAQVVETLDQALLSSGGFSVRPLLATFTAVLDEEGSGYIGQAQFTVFVLS